MEILNSLTLFVVGFAILIVGARYLVRGSISIATLFNVSHWFIGIVVVGIGTAIPELSISIAAALEGSTVGLATIIGSNTFTLLFILGLLAVVRPIFINREWALIDFPINIFSVLVAAGVILFPVFGAETFLGVTRGEGIVLFILFIIWIWFMLSRRQMIEEDGDYRAFTIFASVVMVFGGIIGVFIGGQWVVDGAGTIALLLGVEPGIVGLTLIAVGTSLPELAVSIVGLFKRTVGIAVGNVLGSNIFTFLGVIGLSSLVNPIVVTEAVQFDIFATLAAAIIAFAALFLGRRYTFSRVEGTVFLILYIAYLVLVFLR